MPPLMPQTLSKPARRKVSTALEALMPASQTATTGVARSNPSSFASSSSSGIFLAPAIWPRPKTSALRKSMTAASLLIRPTA